MRKLLIHGRSLLRSIASLPSLIFGVFVLVAIVQLWFTGRPVSLPRWLERLNLSDLDTIRTTLAAVITGVFTLTIFAYTMVMNVLDRSISSYSPRLLPLILSERYHQEILGVGAGTIAHSTILLLGVAEPPDAVQPPLLAAASSGFFAVASLVLFIYFIHRVSRSIHINALLYKSYCHTDALLQAFVGLSDRLTWSDEEAEQTDYFVRAERCGYLTAIDLEALSDIAEVTHVVARPGTFVYRGDPVLRCSTRPAESDEKLTTYYDLSENEPMDVHAVGFRHLVEVAIKAASPAINDPATSLTAMHYLVQLFESLATVEPYNAVRSADRSTVLRVNAWTAEELIRDCYEQLRTYLADDPWGRAAVRRGLQRIERVNASRQHNRAAAAARLELQRLEVQVA